MKTIRWYATHSSPCGKEFVHSALVELEAWLTKAPVGVEVEFVPVPPADGDAIEASLVGETLVREQGLLNWQEGLMLRLADLHEQACGSRNHGKLLLYSPDHFGLLKALEEDEEDRAQQENRTAVKDWWGFNRGWLSVVLKGSNKQLLWHETLHLLGAEDCYDAADPSCQPDCLLDKRCVMQFVPCPENCGEQLVLCKANIDRIRNGK